MFVARFALGFGIGPKSATVPVYAAETAPPAIRGALVMQWQMWTAFGIMLGYAADLIFYQVADTPGIVGLNWRLMMASAMFPALVVCCFVFTCPESPRWYMSKKQYFRAYQSICTLRHHKIQAARDLYYMHVLLEAEDTMVLGQNKLLELITVPRNRRAMIASELVMFMQQFCGVNVIAYYSSEIFLVLQSTTRVLYMLTLHTGSKLLSRFRISSFSRLGRHQLALRNPGNLHNRHLRPPQPLTIYIPPHVRSNVLHGLLLLDP